MSLDSLHALFEDQLRDLYSAEVQLTKALPKMVKRAANDQLREAFEMHLEETRQQAERLQSIGEQLGIRMGGKKCRAMEGLIEEAKEILDEDGEEAVIDAGLIAAAQRVEHYEIAGYGTVRSIANHLGLNDIADTLQEILDQEGEADRKLTELSIEVVYPACGADDEDGAAEEREKASQDQPAAAGGRMSKRSGGNGSGSRAGRGTATNAAKEKAPGRAARARR